MLLMFIETVIRGTIIGLHLFRTEEITLGLKPQPKIAPNRQQGWKTRKKMCDLTSRNLRTQIEFSLKYYACGDRIADISLIIIPHAFTPLFLL
jgi:hypothetical protein